MRKGPASKDEARVYWQEMVHRHQASGLSGKAFCEAEGLSFGTFKGWIYRLRNTDKSVAQKRPLFTPIVIKERGVDQGVFAQKDQESPLILELSGGLRLLIPCGFGGDTLRRVLHVVQGEPHQSDGKRRVPHV